MRKKMRSRGRSGRGGEGRHGEETAAEQIEARVNFGGPVGRPGKKKE